MGRIWQSIRKLFTRQERLQSIYMRPGCRAIGEIPPEYTDPRIIVVHGIFYIISPSMPPARILPDGRLEPIKGDNCWLVDAPKPLHG